MKIKLNEQSGMKLFLVSFFIALTGTFIAFTISPDIGWFIGIGGSTLGIISIIVHFIINKKSIFPFLK